MTEGSSYRRRLHIEPLEDRRMLANVTVSNLNDVVNGNTGSIALLIATPGPDGISLREAILAANADVAADTINFSVEGNINLSSTGQLLISRSVTINGPGQNLLTIRAYDPSGAVGDGRRVLEINDGLAGLINVTINDVTITGGDLGAGGVGAGIWNRGENLTITDSSIRNNRTQHLGGGIGSNSSGTVTISNSTISGNSAGSDALKYGGGIYAASSAGGTAGHLILLTADVNGNSAGKGAGIASRISTTVSGGSISNNTAVLQGGGIWATEPLVVSGSIISGNSAGGQGGGIYGNYTSVSYSSIQGNSVTGISSSGGGIHGGGLITSSTISGNTSARVGAGVSGGFEIVNSTISGNTAAVTGGGVYRQSSESMLIRHSTISGNTAPAGAGSGIASPATLATPKVQLQSSIVAGNTNSDIDRISGSAASIESLGYNLVGTGSGIGAFSAASGDRIGLNPMLGPLANNGGSTLTRALLPGSPAIDAGNPSAVAGVGTVPLYDQRNAPHGRVRGARIDIGAFESAPVVPSLLGDYNRDSAVNAADHVFWRKFLGTTGWVAYAGPDGSGNGTIDPADRAVWRENFSETGAGGGTAGETMEQSSTETRGSSELFLYPRLGETRPHVDESLRDSSPAASARTLVDMVWLTLPAAPEARSGDSDTGPISASFDETESASAIDALDAVFDLLAAG